MLELFEQGELDEIHIVYTLHGQCHAGRGQREINDPSSASG
ncbi:MAG: hypothetical protein ACLTLQ_15630 [[Clostridium] scindens]